MSERVGTALREARARAGYTQRALAAEIGVSAAHLCDIERGYRRIPDALVERLPESVRWVVVAALAGDLEDRLAVLRGLEGRS